MIYSPVLSFQITPLPRLRPKMTFTQYRDTSSGLQLTLNVPHGETLQMAAPAAELQGSSGSRSRWPSATAAGPPWHTCARRPPHTPAHTPARANEPTALLGGREPVVGRGSRGHTALALLPPRQVRPLPLIPGPPR